MNAFANCLFFSRPPCGSLVGRPAASLGRSREADKIMAPAWLTVVAWLYLTACFCFAGIIAYDIAFNHRRQSMGVMNFVFPVTALYLGPFAFALYWRWGRAVAPTTTPPMPVSRALLSRAAAAHASGGLEARGGQHA